MEKKLNFKAYLAEMFGTFVLVLFSCGTAVVSGSYYATAAAFGLSIVAMAYCIGDISGCHINPAVSLAMAIRKKLSWKDFGFYALFQTLGAIIAAALLALFLNYYGTKETVSLGGNVVAPLVKTFGHNANVALVIGLLVEIVLTFAFVMVILGVTKKDKNALVAGFVIGGALTLVHLLGMSLTGTSVNPARSIGPAIFEAILGNGAALKEIWIFIVGPLAGGALAALVFGCFSSKCCCKKGEACAAPEAEAAPAEEGK